MYTDSPKDKEEEDILGRYPFAKQIVNGLTSSFAEVNESIVIGVNGSWGSGKTTLINFILCELINTHIKDRKVLTLKFNPWMFSGQKELQTSFLKQLAIKLEHQDTKIKKAAKKIDEFLNQLEALKYVHSGLGEVIKDAKSVANSLAKERPIEDLKKEIDSLLISNKLKLYISIDDIDRLTPSEITQIFQLVKLNANFANTVFFIAYDREIVNHALMNQFGSHGSKYLDKIVQIDYTLPELNEEKLKEVFKNELKVILVTANINFDINNVWENNLKYYLRNLRDIYRLLNALKLRLPSIHQEVNIMDFLLLESIRIFDYTSFEFIFRNKEKFLNLNRNNNSQLVIDSTFKEQIKGLTFPANNIIGNLFNIEKSISSFQIHFLIIEKRICHPFYFDRYFSLQLSPENISEKIFSDISKEEDEIKIAKIINKFILEDKLHNFLDILEIKTRRLEDNSLSKICIGIIKQLEKEKYFDWRYNNRCNFNVLNLYLSRVISNIKNYDIKFRIIEEYFLNANHSYNFYHLLLLNEIKSSIAKYRLKDLYDNNQWSNLFNDETIQKFENLILIRLDGVLDNLLDKLLLDEVHFSNDEVFYLLREISNKNSSTYESIVLKLSKNIHSLCQLLSVIVSQHYASGSLGVGYYLPLKTAFPVLDEEIIDLTISSNQSENLSDDEILVINFYQNCKSEGFPERKYFDYHTFKVIEYGSR